MISTQSPEQQLHEPQSAVPQSLWQRFMSGVNSVANKIEQKGQQAISDVAEWCANTSLATYLADSLTPPKQKLEIHLSQLQHSVLNGSTSLGEYVEIMSRVRSYVNDECQDCRLEGFYDKVPEDLQALTSFEKSFNSLLSHDNHALGNHLFLLEAQRQAKKWIGTDPEKRDSEALVHQLQALQNYASKLMYAEVMFMLYVNAQKELRENPEAESYETLLISLDKAFKVIDFNKLKKAIERRQRALSEIPFSDALMMEDPDKENNNTSYPRTSSYSYKINVGLVAIVGLLLLARGAHAALQISNINGVTHTYEPGVPYFFSANGKQPIVSGALNGTLSTFRISLGSPGPRGTLETNVTSNPIPPTFDGLAFQTGGPEGVVNQEMIGLSYTSPTSTFCDTFPVTVIAQDASGDSGFTSFSLQGICPSQIPTSTHTPSQTLSASLSFTPSSSYTPTATLSLGASPSKTPSSSLTQTPSRNSTALTVRPGKNKNDAGTVARDAAIGVGIGLPVTIVLSICGCVVVGLFAYLKKPWQNKQTRATTREGHSEANGLLNALSLPESKFGDFSQGKGEMLCKFAEALYSATGLIGSDEQKTTQIIKALRTGHPISEPSRNFLTCLGYDEEKHTINPATFLKYQQEIIDYINQVAAPGTSASSSAPQGVPVAPGGDSSTAALSAMSSTIPLLGALPNNRGHVSVFSSQASALPTGAAVSIPLLIISPHQDSESDDRKSNASVPAPGASSKPNIKAGSQRLTSAQRVQDTDSINFKRASNDNPLFSPQSPRRSSQPPHAP